jgi:hypothetical protein
VKIGRLALVVAALSAVSAVAGARYRGHQARVADRPGEYVDPARNVRAPENVRIRVEVLNASTVRGLARRAATYLRDRGFDVVHIGSSPERSDSTLVLDRTGHPDWASLLAEAMGGTAVTRPDTSRYVDATVLVGATWRPPPRPFYP